MNIYRLRTMIYGIVAGTCLLTTSQGQLVNNGLVLDLDADKGVTTQEGNRVIKWTNQVRGFPADDFVISPDEPRISDPEGPLSGRPLLKTNVAALSGHNSLQFLEDELINYEEDAFDRFTTGGGFTWFAVIAPYLQNQNGGRNLKAVNAFFGNLESPNEAPAGNYEGFWAGFTQDRHAWAGARNGLNRKRDSANNVLVHTPVLPANTFYVLAGRLGAGTGTVQLEIFVDSPIPSETKAFPVRTNVDPSRMAIGTERDAQNHPSTGIESFDGELARILMYDRPLSNAEFLQTMNELKDIYFNGGGTTPPSTSSDVKIR